MHFYDGGCGRCGRHKGEFLGRLPYSIFSLKEEVVREKFAWILKPGRRCNNAVSNSSVHLCDKCWEKWKSPVPVDWKLKYNQETKRLEADA